MLSPFDKGTKTPLNKYTRQSYNRKQHQWKSIISKQNVLDWLHVLLITFFYTSLIHKWINLYSTMLRLSLLIWMSPINLQLDFSENIKYMPFSDLGTLKISESFEKYFNSKTHWNSLYTAYLLKHRNSIYTIFFWGRILKPILFFCYSSSIN